MLTLIYSYRVILYTLKTEEKERTTLSVCLSFSSFGFTGAQLMQIRDKKKNKTVLTRIIYTSHLISGRISVNTKELKNATTSA